MTGKSSNEIVAVRKDVLMALLGEVWKAKQWLESCDERSWTDEQTLLRSDADELKELLERVSSIVDVLTGSVAELRHLVVDVGPFSGVSRQGWQPKKITGGS